MIGIVNMSGSSQDSTLRGSALKTEEGEVDKKEPKKKVSFYKLFSFADSGDKVLMIIGTIGAIANGLARPLMTLIFGDLIDVLGKAQRTDIVSLVSEVCK